MSNGHTENFKDKAPIILTVLNVILVALMGVVGYMAKDLHTQVMSYPNTEIREDVEALDNRLRSKVDADKVDLMTDELRGQYHRLCEQMDRQNEKLDEINIYLRDSAGGE